MATFRDVAFNISPPRLQTEKAANYVYAFIGLPLDMIAQAAKESVLARFPSYCPEDALPYHGRDRGIPRGPAEPKESFIARLLEWRQLEEGSGVGRAMLDELAAYLQPSLMRLRIWTQAGMIYTREADGFLLIDHSAPMYWNWDNSPGLYARSWLVIYSDPDVAGFPFSRDGTWGDGGTWGDDPTTGWGSTATLNQIAGIRSIVSQRKPGQNLFQNIIVSFDELAFEPGDTVPPLPDGTWRHWSKNVAGTQVRTRDDRGIYWDGVA